MAVTGTGDGPQPHPSPVPLLQAEEPTVRLQWTPGQGVRAPGGQGSHHQEPGQVQHFPKNTHLCVLEDGTGSIRHRTPRAHARGYTKVISLALAV